MFVYQRLLLFGNLLKYVEIIRPPTLHASILHCPNSTWNTNIDKFHRQIMVQIISQIGLIISYNPIDEKNPLP